MSANEDPQIAALRDAGFDDAADHLAEQAQLRQKRDEIQQRQEQERQVIRNSIPLGIAPVDPFEAQRQADAAVAYDALRRSGVGQSFSAGSILSDDRRDGR